MEKKRMEFQKNEQVEELKRLVATEREAFQREREAYLRDLDQLRKQAAQLTTAYNAARADVGAAIAERDALRRVATACRESSARQERRAAEK
eukprot:4156613-Lingulodinium_polyedra.AAC.1